MKATMCGVTVALAAPCFLAMPAAVARGQALQEAPIERLERVRPKRIALVDPQGRMLTDWVEVQSEGSEQPQGCEYASLYDCFDTEDDGCTEQAYSWFGEGFNNSFMRNDMKMVDGAGNTITQFKYAWYWGQGGPFYLQVFNAEDFNSDCTGSGGTFSGVILDFGSLNAGGFYYADVDLCGLGLELQAPADGEGSHTIEMGEYYDGAHFQLATSAQPMLWGAQGADDGSQGAEILTRQGCKFYTNPGGCPDPLGPAIAFYGPRADTCFSLDVSPIIQGQRATFTVTGGPSGPRRYACLAATSEGSSLLNGQFGFCASLGIEVPGDPRRQVVFVIEDSDGTFVVERPVPTIVPMETIYFQAAASGTCPEPCSSGVVRRLVQ